MQIIGKTIEEKIIGAKFLGCNRINTAAIQISTDRGTVDVTVEGDCCSHSIFYDVIVPEECYGTIITSFDDWARENCAPILTEEQVSAKADEVCGKGNWYSECLSIWDVKFQTTNGNILLRHVNSSNSSNGYYDGMINIRCNY